MRLLPPPVCKSILAAAAALSLAACNDTAPEIPTEELYLRGFVKQFGVPAEGHTWSMATPVDAELNLGSAVNGTARFYTTAPESPASKVLAEARVDNGRCKMRFDVHGGTRQVYVRVADAAGMTAFSGFLEVRDGRISNINASGSRAGDCNVQVTEVTDYMVKRMDDEKMRHVSEFIKNHPNDYLDKTWKDILDECGLDQNRYPTQTFAVKNLYKLQDVTTYTERSEIFPFEEIAPIIFKYTSVTNERIPGPFSESYDSEKKADNINKYYHQEKKLDADAVTIVKQKGPVTLDLMWKGSQEGNSPILGYYYYTEDDEELMVTDPLAFFDKVPKFIVFDKEHEMNSNSNDAMMIQYCKRSGQHYDENRPDDEWNFKNDPCWTEGTHQIEDAPWEVLSSSQAVAVTGNNNKFRAANLQSIRIKLVYRGEDGKKESTFDFPEDVRIGFFSGTAGESDKFYLSNAALNFYLFAYNYTQLGFSEDEQTPETLPTATRFAFNGGNYLGLETERDFDLNDLVFRITNADPAPDITPQDFPKPKTEEWILACEDLGTTDDYDFNDVVLKLERAAGTTSLKVTPLACGGVLNSFIHFGGNDDNHLWGEIHDLLGVQRGVMAGVGNGYSDIIFSRVESRTFDVPEDWLASTHYGDFSIFTQEIDATHMNEGYWINKEAAPEGNTQLRAPQMLLLPGDWRWPIERKHIRTVYPGFKDWLQHPENYENYGWTNAEDVEEELRYVRID